IGKAQVRPQIYRQIMLDRAVVTRLLVYEDRAGQKVPVIIYVELNAQPHLPEIVDAGDLLGLRFGFCQRRQKHRRQDRDDGDDHEQLDKREGTSWVQSLLHSAVGFLSDFGATQETARGTISSNP